MQRAYEVLRDASSRRSYDATLVELRRRRLLFTPGSNELLPRTAATPVPVACVATVGRRALVGLPEVRRLHPPGARQELAAARLAALAEAALPVGAADGAFAFFTLSGDTPLHGVAVVRDAVAVCALSPLPLHSLLHARLGANAAALFPSWIDAEFGADGALAQLHRRAPDTAETPRSCEVKFTDYARCERRRERPVI